MTHPLPGFDLIAPDSLTAALATRRASPQSRFIAGGTDLLVNIRRGIRQPETLIDISALPELTALTHSKDGVRIGAAVTLSALARDSAIMHHYPAIAEAASAIAGPSHRSRATVGGNLCLDTRCVYFNQSEWWRRANGYCLKHQGDTCHVAPQGDRCHAAFSGDLAPALIALGAEVEIASPEKQRRIALETLYVDDGRAHLALADDEIVVAAYLPETEARNAYAKIRVRGSMDFPLAGVAVALTATAGVLNSLRIALTGTNSRPILLAGSEAFVGKAVDEDVLRAIDKLVQHQIKPMRTTLIASNYRRLAAAATARRLVAKLAAE